MLPYKEFLPTNRFQQTLSVSPDGDRVAYVDDSTGDFNVAIKPVSGGTSQILTSFDDRAVRRVAWHPDGRSLALLADMKGDEKAQLYMVDADSGELSTLTDTPGVQFAAALGDPFSPDGRMLAYAGNDRSRTDQDVLIRDLAAGEVRRIYAGGGRMFAGYWSPDGTRLTASEFRDGETDHVVHVVSVDGESKRLTSLELAAPYWLGPWLPDGTGFVVRTNFGREFTGLAIMDSSTGGLRWLDTPPWDVEAASLSRDGRVLVWSVNVDGHSRLHAHDLDADIDLEVPRLPAGAVSALTLTPDGGSVLMWFTTSRLPVNVVVADLRTGELRWLTEATPPAAASIPFVEPALVRFPARDGRDTPAYLYRPAETADSAGVVLSIHGGPDYQERPTYMYDGFYQYLASNGVAVLAPNFRGSTGYGVSNIRLIHHDWGGGELDDIAGAVDYLRSLGWVDPARIALFGGSYGGFAVLSCLARLPELGWAAGVDLFGPSNLVTLAKGAPPTWRKRVATMIGDPDSDHDFLMSRSPVTHVDRISAPLFVIQGANDPRVPRVESDQIVERLRARGVAVRYDVYPDEGHGFVKRSNRTKVYSDMGEFLLAHLR